MYVYSLYELKGYFTDTPNSDINNEHGLLVNFIQNLQWKVAINEE